MHGPTFDGSPGSPRRIQKKPGGRAVPKTNGGINDQSPFLSGVQEVARVVVTAVSCRAPGGFAPRDWGAYSSE